MSAILLVLMTGLTMFGVAGMEPASAEGEAPDTDEVPDEPEAPASDEGSNPIDEARRIMDEEAANAAAAAAATGVIVAGSDVGTLLVTEGGDDIIDAGGGDDTIEAGAGADRVAAGEGNDVVFGNVADGSDDGDADTLSGGDGDDTIHMGAMDQATGGEGADTFVRLSDVTARITLQDFDEARDMIVVNHQSDTPPVIADQRVVSDGVIVDLSDGSTIELVGLRNPVDPGLFTFVDTR